MCGFPLPNCGTYFATCSKVDCQEGLQEGGWLRQDQELLLDTSATQSVPFPGALLRRYSFRPWSECSKRLRAAVNTGARSETAPYSGPVPGPKVAYCYAHLDPCHALIPPQAKARRAMAQPVCDDENHLSLPQRVYLPPQVTGRYNQTVM